MERIEMSGKEFEHLEVLRQVLDGVVGQKVTAERLRLTDRQVRRLLRRYEAEGAAGLVDRRLTQVSHRKAPVDEVMALVERYRSRHMGWNVKHFHAWYEREGGKVDKVHLTQFGRAMARLGFQLIPAYSPEARGRSERMFRTHQDRLPKELAAAGITDMASANRYLKEVYMPAFNAEFMQPAQEEGSAFVAWVGDELDDFLCEHYERVEGKDNCVAFEGLKLQIPPDRYRMHYVKVKVRVHRYLDGWLAIFHGSRRLARYTADGQLQAPELQVVA